jgi:hypothetical protein
MKVLIKKLNFTSLLFMMLMVLYAFAFIKVSKAGYTCGDDGSYTCPSTPGVSCLGSGCIAAQSGCASYTVTKKKCVTGGTNPNCCEGHAGCSVAINIWDLCNIMCMRTGEIIEVACYTGNYPNRCIY